MVRADVDRDRAIVIIKTNIRGINSTIRRFAELKRRGSEIVEEAVFDTATHTHRTAVQGIQKGPASGRVYARYLGRRGGRLKRPRRHQASAPGEYPASDTGRLASSVQMDQQTRMRIYVGTRVKYGRHLEYGTSRMAARPWLLPSFKVAIKATKRSLRDSARQLRRRR